MSQPTNVVDINRRRAAVVKVLRDTHGGDIRDHLPVANQILQALDELDAHLHPARRDPARAEALNVLHTWSRDRSAVAIDHVVAAVAVLTLASNGGVS